MIRWRDDIDPRSIPDPVVYTEAQRRRGDKCVCGWASEQHSRASKARKTFGAGPGRPKRLVTCPGCGKVGGVAEMRKHKC